MRTRNKTHTVEVARDDGARLVVRTHGPRHRPVEAEVSLRTADGDLVFVRFKLDDTTVIEADGVRRNLRGEPR